MPKEPGTPKCAALDHFVLQSLPLAAVIFDRDLKIISANSSALELIEIGKTADATLSAGTNEKIWGNWQSTLLEVIEKGKICRFDNVAFTVAGGQAILEITCAPLRESSTSDIKGGLLLLEDITQRANIKKQLEHTERLAALGKLASKVAHELNNPIDGIMRYINLAKRAISEKGLAKPVEYLEHAGAGLERMVQIITELLEFSRNKYSPLEDMPLDKMIDDSIRFMAPAARAAEIEIEKQYSLPLPKMKVGNLFQVFCNLLKNAIEAMPDGGKVTISCNVSEDNIAIIKFQDTGQGFEPQNSEAIFEPFFTTKTGGKGTGLGLAICRDIMEKAGGKVIAQNAPDQGSIFTVYLPVTE